MDAIEHTCNRRKSGRKVHIRIDGSTPATDRSRLVNSFQDDDDMRVAILSIKAAGVGLTLTAASTVVFAEMTWTPGEIIQAEGKINIILKDSNNMQYSNNSYSISNVSTFELILSVV